MLKELSNDEGELGFLRRVLEADQHQGVVSRDAAVRLIGVEGHHGSVHLGIRALGATSPLPAEVVLNANAAVGSKTDLPGYVKGFECARTQVSYLYGLYHTAVLEEFGSDLIFAINALDRFRDMFSRCLGDEVLISRVVDTPWTDCLAISMVAFRPSLSGAPEAEGR